MKVGILTWHFGCNYGAKAQVYALQQVVQKLGYEAYVVNYKPKISKKINLTMNLNIENKYIHPLRVINAIWRCIKFDNFMGRYNLTDVCESVDEIEKLNLDCIVFGSDAIFNTEHPFFDSLYYGVGINASKKIAYSPSCEYLSTDYRFPIEYNNSLRDFTAISVRDVNTSELIKANTQINPTITLDPTLLYDFSEIKYEIPYEDYVLIYTFSDWSVYSDDIREFARQKNCKIISVGKYYKCADVSYDAASVECWIASFRKAKYVFTDSFHGTVFSIKNSKEIILLGRFDKQAKITSLLADAGIHRGFYDGSVSINTYLNDEIDYTQVNKNMKTAIDNSMDYLSSALSKCSE